ncbi:MAG TPA: hypothetical protein VN030_16025 [Cellvibrio sp.]|nr:hypothetical protein [Cellvibrio sp.]
MDAKSISLDALNIPSPNNSIITLTHQQYLFYQFAYLDLHSPDCSHLQTLGYGVKKNEVDYKIYRLREYLYAMEYLLGNLNSSLDLPPQATSALADLLCGMQGFCRKYIW